MFAWLYCASPLCAEKQCMAFRSIFLLQIVLNETRWLPYPNSNLIFIENVSRLNRNAELQTESRLNTNEIPEGNDV